MSTVIIQSTVNNMPVPSVLWRCWLGGRKGIRRVKNWVVGCWHGYLSGARCRLWPSWCHCHPRSLASVNSRLVLPLWYRLTQVVPDKRPLNGCSVEVVVSIICNAFNAKPELSRTWCCQSSQIQSHHSHPAVSALAKNNGAHWIQAPFTYLQSSYNHPTFISA